MTEHDTVWTAEQSISGRLVARIGRRGSELVAEFRGLGTLRSAVNGYEAHFEPHPDADPEAIEKLDRSLLDALVRHARGKLTLHGSVVAHEEQAVALVGVSGVGKSTLSACCCAFEDLELVADDTVAIEMPNRAAEPSPVLVLPTQSSSWLLPSARELLGLDATTPAKVSVPPRRRRESPAVLRAIVGLVFDDSASMPSLIRVGGRVSFALLTRSVLRFVIDDPANQVREFEQLAMLTTRCPVFVLRQPFDRQQLRSSSAIVKRLLIESTPETTMG